MVDSAFTSPISVPGRDEDRHAALSAGARAQFFRLDEADRTRLDAEADHVVERIFEIDPRAPDYVAEAERISGIGQREIAEAAGHSNRLLGRSARSIDGENAIGVQLAALRRAVEDLDPASAGKFLVLKRLLRRLPFSSGLGRYVSGWRSAEVHISSILKRLASGKEEILRDNAVIDAERHTLWAMMEQLEKLIHITQALDERLERRLADLDGDSAEKGRTIRETALFYARQRRQDLLTQMAVTAQGYFALDIIRKGNIELAKGVDRASTTTVAALRTATTVAHALSSQGRVARQVGAFNTATTNVIEWTSTTLRAQSAEIHRQAASTTIPVETIRRAFLNVYEVLDDVNKSKAVALETMKNAIDALDIEIARARQHINET